MSRRRAVWLGWMLGYLLVMAPSAWAQTDQLIYTDSLVNGWQDWSWATVSLANGSPVHSGTHSASVNADAWEAIYLHHDAFDTSVYTGLVFWIHGGATGGQLLKVEALLDGTLQAEVDLPPLPANTWQQVTVSLTSLGVANRPNMDGFWIKDRSGTTKPAFYVDDVRLTAAPPPAVVNVTVDASQTLRTVDARHFGVNAAMWDAVFDTPTTIALLSEMGNRALRFPGGSLSNNYHWQTNTTDSNTWQWETSFDDFAHVATATAAQVFISVNYGSGTPAEAAAWVRYANVTKGHGFKYWELGNENYGGWETDLNVRPHDPYTYAQRFKQYYDQMKAVDPTIKVGAVAVTGEDSYATYTDHPASNPRTGQAHNGWTPVMLATLKSLGVTPDFLIHHRYAQAPGAESDAGLLQSSNKWGADAADLRRQLTDYLGAAGAGVELVCTENNSVFTDPGKQTTSLVNGLFLAGSLGTAMKTEFNAVLWWDLRNGQDVTNNNAASLYGWRLYGDYGIVNDATPAGPADRYPTFYVAKLLQYFARGGDRLVEAGSDYGLLSVYAARRADGSLTLLAINKSSTTTLNANITLHGYTPNGPVHTSSYGIPQDEAARTGVGSADIAMSSAGSAGSNFAFAFPPYSVAVLSLNGASSPSAPANLGQFKSNGSTAIGVGGSTDETTVVLKGTMSDPDGNTVKLQVEVRPLSIGFSNTATQESSLVSSGSVASVTVSSLMNSTGYHWQARAVDSQGAASGWIAFGGNAESAADFTVNPIPRVLRDFNGDGTPDLVWQNDTTRQVFVWYMGGAQGNVFQGGNWLASAGAPGWKVVGSHDSNGDGKPDLVWQDDTTRQVVVWYLGGAQGNVFQGLNWLTSTNVPGWRAIAR